MLGKKNTKRKPQDGKTDREIDDLHEWERLVQDGSKKFKNIIRKIWVDQLVAFEHWENLTKLVVAAAHKKYTSSGIAGFDATLAKKDAGNSEIAESDLIDLDFIIGFIQD